LPTEVKEKEVGRNGHGCAQNGGSEVVAGERSGAQWRARGRTPGKGYSGGRSRGDAWRESGQKLNGDEGRVVARGAALTAEQRRQGRSRAEQVLGEEEERGGGVQGPVCKTQELQGLFGNLIFPTDLGVF
jgi:hypothetical protein